MAAMLVVLYKWRQSWEVPPGFEVRVTTPHEYWERNGRGKVGPQGLQKQIEATELSARMSQRARLLNWLRIRSE